MGQVHDPRLGRLRHALSDRALLQQRQIISVMHAVAGAGEAHTQMSHHVCPGQQALQEQRRKPSLKACASTVSILDIHGATAQAAPDVAKSCLGWNNAG